jgi:hypothetical protein
MNWRNLSWAIRRSPHSNKRNRAEGDSSADAKRNASPLRIVRIVEHNWKDIGAPNAANQQSIIGAPSGTSLPIYSTNS